MAKKAFLLRVDAELWAEIERWAADELRSANGQVEFVLREAVRKRRGSAPDRERPTGDPDEAPKP